MEVKAMDKTIGVRYELLQRRRFITAVIVGGGSLIAHLNGKANSHSKSDQSPNSITPELLLLPTPADALVDYLRLTSEIEASILRKYYTIVGALVGKVADKYGELKQLVLDFQTLVPGLTADGRVDQIRTLTDIGQESAMSVRLLNVSDATSIDRQLTILISASTSLAKFNDLNHRQQGSITLTLEGVQKLRAILRKVLELNEPTEQMKKASGMLTTVSNDLRVNIKEAQSNLSAAISLLVNVDLMELPTSGTSPSAANLRASSELRATAIERIKAAQRSIAILGNYMPPPEFQAYLESTNPHMADGPQLSHENTTQYSKLLQALLEGTITWIMEGREVAFREINDSVRFVKVNLVPPMGWIALWNNIRGLLGELIPEATTDRTRQLWWRKKCISIYSQDDQHTYFYNLLPRLNPPSSKDLYAAENRKDLDAAAWRLARF
jgi:hypothetical protein